MKKLCAILAALTPLFAAAQMQVVVDNNGALQYPTAGNFKAQNDIASGSEVVKKSDLKKVWLDFDVSPTIDIQNPYFDSNRTLSLATPHYVNASGSRVATTNSTGEALTTSYRYKDSKSNIRRWTDLEFKIIRRSDGELVYWVSTQAGATDMNYAQHPARDANARIFYTVSGSANDGRNWIERSDTDSYSNYSHAFGHTDGLDFAIGGVVIEPNIAGKTVGGSDIINFFNGSNAGEYYYIYIKIDSMGIERSADGSPIWRPYNAPSKLIWGLSNE